MADRLFQSHPEYAPGWMHDDDHAREDGTVPELSGAFVFPFVRRSTYEHVVSLFRARNSELARVRQQSVEERRALHAHIRDLSAECERLRSARDSSAYKQEEP